MAGVSGEGEVALAPVAGRSRVTINAMTAVTPPATKSSPPPPSVSVLLTEKVLSSIWGPGGSWTMFGDMPHRKEAPMCQRSHKVLPAGAVDDKNMPTLAAINTKGRKGVRDTTVGQDNFSVSLLPNGWEVYCVMDGHGTYGHWPSTRAVRTMPYFLQQEGCTKFLKDLDPTSALQLAFSQVEAEMELASAADSIDIETSGSTATCVLRNPLRCPDRIWVATAGDSRCILLETGNGGSLIEESCDHRPLLPEEKNRLESSGSDVRTLEHANGYVEVRVFVAGEEYPGLCMSRSLGDTLMKDRGVIADPQVVEWKVAKQRPVYVLLASDGVWEFLESKQAATIVQQDLSEQPDLVAACRRLLRKSQELWQTNEGSYCDDITMVMCAVGGPNAMPLVPFTIAAVTDVKAGACGNGCSWQCAVQ
eukprot:TRINITY_DN19365_c0_g1_i1.p1 TRINITY_DN19365_c0_g1~~TRINITY_DN19365_c0_g1_i1.p1  ORF type:complete len:420 (-),score=79.60 TRINITY_DN19365_c0_g1_i1:72-1331(-)